MNCKICHSACNKNGFQTNGKQRYYCKNCKLSQQKTYRYNACLPSTSLSIQTLLINSCGITDISRVLNISRNTVKKRILAIERKAKIPSCVESFQNYEMDELRVKINGKIRWVIYAINRKTRQVIDYVVGRRTNNNLSKIINTLLLLDPRRIYTNQKKIFG